MNGPPPQDKLTIFRDYPRPVVHLRREFEAKRLSLVFGAGVSKGFGIPNWEELVEKIANYASFKGVLQADFKASLGTKVEILQRHFFDTQRKTLEGGKPPNDVEIKGKWFEILRNLIYEKMLNEKDLDLTHPYIGNYIKIIIASPVTITYNFDSCIELCLDAWAKRNKPKKQRLYETIFPDMLPTRTRGSIFHVNGYLPKNSLDIYSEDLVFTEQQFADQFLETTTGRFATLAHYYATNTCLFIGLSLSDENIRYLLRRIAINHPGHYHYHIRWHRTGQRESKDLERTLADHYFDTYNLITLFLDDVGIKSLGELIHCGFDELYNLAKGAPLKRFFYITGVPSSGKTSVRRSMRGLVAYPEWQRPPPELMNKPYNVLSEEETKKVDGWIAEQFKRKNEKLAGEREGIFIVDRAPLDPLSFTKEKDMKEKTIRYWDAIVPSFGATLEPGSIILLIGDTKVMSTRLARKTGSAAYTPEYLEKLQDNLKKVYKNKNTHIIDTSRMDLDQVVKRVAHIIHREEYKVVVLTCQSLEEKGS